MVLAVSELNDTEIFSLIQLLRLPDKRSGLPGIKTCFRSPA
jgi:hypothetical protein